MKMKINYFDEFILTLSNRKSLFSSKKIERFIVFTTMITISLVYLVMNMRGMDALDFIQVVGLFLAYGGYNSLMTLRDRKLNNDIDESEEESQEGGN